MSLARNGDRGRPRARGRGRVRGPVVPWSDLLPPPPPAMPIAHSLPPPAIPFSPPPPPAIPFSPPPPPVIPFSPPPPPATPISTPPPPAIPFSPPPPPAMPSSLPPRSVFKDVIDIGDSQCSVFQEMLTAKVIPRIAVDNFMFYLHKQGVEHAQWKCTRVFTKSCPSLVRTTLDMVNPYVVAAEHDHSHRHDWQAVVQLQTRLALVRKAAERHHRPPQCDFIILPQTGVFDQKTGKRLYPFNSEDTEEHNEEMTFYVTDPVSYDIKALTSDHHHNSLNQNGRKSTEIFENISYHDNRTNKTTPSKKSPPVGIEYSSTSTVFTKSINISDDSDDNDIEMLTISEVDDITVNDQSVATNRMNRSKNIQYNGVSNVMNNSSNVIENNKQLEPYPSQKERFIDLTDSELDQISSQTEKNNKQLGANPRQKEQFIDLTDSELGQISSQTEKNNKQLKANPSQKKQFVDLTDSELDHTSSQTTKSNSGTVQLLSPYSPKNTDFVQENQKIPSTNVSTSEMLNISIPNQVQPSSDTIVLPDTSPSSPPISDLEVARIHSTRGVVTITVNNENGENINPLYGPLLAEILSQSRSSKTDPIPLALSSEDNFGLNSSISVIPVSNNDKLLTELPPEIPVELPNELPVELPTESPAKEPVKLCSDGIPGQTCLIHQLLHVLQRNRRATSLSSLSTSSSSSSLLCDIQINKAYSLKEAVPAAIPLLSTVHDKLKKQFPLDNGYKKALSKLVPRLVIHKYRFPEEGTFREDILKADIEFHYNVGIRTLKYSIKSYEVYSLRVDDNQTLEECSWSFLRKIAPIFYPKILSITVESNYKSCRYYFSVRIQDNLGRYSAFSVPQCSESDYNII